MSGTRLTITCPYHHDQVIVDLCCGGSEVPGDWLENNNGLTVEYVGYQPTPAERARAGKLPFLQFAVAAPAHGDQSHLRYHFRCPKPSCPYDGQLDEESWGLPETFLHGLAEQGVASYVITDLDEFLRGAARGAS